MEPGNWQGQTWPTLHTPSTKGYLQCVFVHWRDLESKSKSTAHLLENGNSSTTAPNALFSPWWASTASESDRLCCSSWSCFRCAAALSACTLPAYARLENHPFRRTRASDVLAALPCLRPGFPILVSRQSRRQIEASIDRGQISRTHTTGHAVESPTRLRWQPRIIVRYSRGPQPRRNTKWRRPRYTLRQESLCLSLLSFLIFLQYGIEQVEGLLPSKIHRKCWPNVPPKLLTCVGFLFKVVQKNGPLRKFNPSREIEFNFFYHLVYLLEIVHTCWACSGHKAASHLTLKLFPRH